MEEMNDAISFLYYGDRSGRFMRAFEKLTLNEAFPWHRVIRWLESDESERPAVLKNALPDILKAPELNVRLAEAPSYGLPLCYYDKSGKGTDAYERAAKELLRRI